MDKTIIFTGTSVYSILVTIQIKIKNCMKVACLDNVSIES